MPSVDITVMDAPLIEVNNNGNELYICEAPIPTTRAEAIARALHSAAVVRVPETISGTAATNRRYTDGTTNDYTGIQLNNIGGSPKTPAFVAVCSASLLLQVADIAGGTALSDGTFVDLSSWDYIQNAPTT